MKGKYEILVKDAHLQYKFMLQRNITILQGDSATGKTTLINMIADRQRMGEDSGVELRSSKPCYVVDEGNWRLLLPHIHDSFVFIDEAKFVREVEFARMVKGSSNYFVIATRVPLSNLPYSVQEIYGIKNKAGNKYQSTKRLYAEFYPLVKPKESEALPDLAVVEDSHAGYEFFQHYFSRRGIRCISAEGKDNIYRRLVEEEYGCALVIADGAAFGPEVERVLSLQRARQLILYMPESFEYLLLEAGIVRDGEIAAILEDPSAYIESAVYFSWEQFFTELLTDKTKITYLNYTKSRLNPVYLRENIQAEIIDLLPDSFKRQ